MKRFGLAGTLVAAALSSGLFTACGPIPNTGFEVQIVPPTDKKAGVDYNLLYVAVTADDGVQEATTIPVTATTPQPFTVVVLMNGHSHNSATFTVTLFDQTPGTEGNPLDVAELANTELTQVSQGHLVTVTMDLSTL